MLAAGVLATCEVELFAPPFQACLRNWHVMTLMLMAVIQNVLTALESRPINIQCM